MVHLLTTSNTDVFVIHKVKCHALFMRLTHGLGWFMNHILYKLYLNDIQIKC